MPRRYDDYAARVMPRSTPPDISMRLRCSLFTVTLRHTSPVLRYFRLFTPATDTVLIDEEQYVTSSRIHIVQHRRAARYTQDGDHHAAYAPLRLMTFFRVYTCLLLLMLMP